MFGSLLLIDITAEDIADYQKTRLKEGASPKTVNLEVGSLRAIFRRHRIWASLQPDVKMLSVRDDVGRALTNGGRRAAADRLSGVTLTRAGDGRDAGPSHRDATRGDPGPDMGTTVRMARRYGHISQDAQREAVVALMPRTPTLRCVG